MKTNSLLILAGLLAIAAGLFFFGAPDGQKQSAAPEPLPRVGAGFEQPGGAVAVPASRLPTLPVPGMVTMIDLGAKGCVPCRMMEPILAELEAEYAGRAAIVFIDIDLHREEATRYRVRAIPTQIFYDANGMERYRHEGFLDKATIEATLRALGVS